MNAITDEFLLAQAVAGKIIDRQRKQIDTLERAYAVQASHVAQLTAKLADCAQTIAAYQAKPHINDAPT